MKKNLYLREWLFLFSILGFLVTLCAISWLSSRGAEYALTSPKYHSKTIQIQIDGEVKNPGSYSFQDKVTFQEILNKAKPKIYADLSGYELNKQYSESINLTLPKLEKIIISIHREGENPLLLEMPLGSRVKDLRQVMPDHGEFMKSRRLLRHGEKILFPRKKPDKK